MLKARLTRDCRGRRARHELEPSLSSVNAAGAPDPQSGSAFLCLPCGLLAFGSFAFAYLLAFGRDKI